jgi:hypothetical protein
MQSAPLCYPDLGCPESQLPCERLDLESSEVESHFFPKPLTESCMVQSLPPRSQIFLWKVDGSWAFNLSYPPGTAVPSTSKPFSVFPQHSNLGDVYKEITRYVDDEPLEGGKPPGRDPFSDPDRLPDGTLVSIEKDRGGYKLSVHPPTGGLENRMDTYHSIADALVGIKILHDGG